MEDDRSIALKKASFKPLGTGDLTTQNLFMKLKANSDEKTVEPGPQRTTNCLKTPVLRQHQLMDGPALTPDGFMPRPC